MKEFLWPKITRFQSHQLSPHLTIRFSNQIILTQHFSGHIFSIEEWVEFVYALRILKSHHLVQVFNSQITAHTAKSTHRCLFSQVLLALVNKNVKLTFILLGWMRHLNIFIVPIHLVSSRKMHSSLKVTKIKTKRRKKSEKMKNLRK